jgi:stage III sporulation protein AA
LIYSSNSNKEELEKLLVLLPKRIRDAATKNVSKLDKLIDIVLDLGRLPELRFHGEQPLVLNDAVTREEIDFICNKLSSGFSSENRAGIEKTLHRISAIRNRRNEIIGLSCRVGKTMTGTVQIIEDLLSNNKSILLLGPPGCGKTTRLREIAQLYADKYSKRVVIVDTSNEIGGDGDIPHPSIGRARRMPVIDPSQQHKVMIEAVENHTPEVIVIDEISTEEEANAAQTIAERGVILVATAHGRDLESVVKNPPLSILIGDPQTVTLSDEEAKRRKSQKSILERSRESTFQTVVELISHSSMILHHDVDFAVDQILRGGSPIHAELRDEGEYKPQIKEEIPIIKAPEVKPTKSSTNASKIISIYPYAVSHSQLYAVIKALELPAKLVDSVDDADMVIALEDYASPGAKIHKLAEMLNIRLETIQHNNFSEISHVLSKITKIALEEDPETSLALEEAHKGIESFKANGKSFDLLPRKAQIRKAQQEFIEKSGFKAEIVGEGAEKRMRIIKF